jgi:hypothetical protein
MATAEKQQSGKVQQKAHELREGVSKGTRHAMDETAQETNRAVDRMRGAMKEPTTGAAVAGAAVIGAGAIFGFGPAGVGAIAGYAVYRMAKSRKASRSAS